MIEKKKEEKETIVHMQTSDETNRRLGRAGVDTDLHWPAKHCNYCQMP